MPESGENKTKAFQWGSLSLSSKSELQNPLHQAKELEGRGERGMEGTKASHFTSKPQFLHMQVGITIMGVRVTVPHKAYGRTNFGRGL
jgi:hypothetical protein